MAQPPSSSRAMIPGNDSVSAADRRKGTQAGAYVAHHETGDLKCILLATGSEVQHAINAAIEIGDGVRVVSMPCFERFDRQADTYKEQVLPSSCRARVAIEAGVSSTWAKYIGIDGKAVCIDRFGISAPGDQVMENLGITANHVAM